MSERFNEIQSVSTVSGVSTYPKPKFRFTIGGIILTIVLITIAVVVPTSIILVRTTHPTTITTSATKAALRIVTLKSTTTQNEILQKSTIISKLREKSIDSISISADEESSKTSNVHFDNDRCDRSYIDLYSFPLDSKIHSMITANLDRSFHFPVLIVAFTNPGKIEIFSMEKSVRLVEKLEFESFQPTAMLVADIDRHHRNVLFVFNANRNELILFLNFKTTKNHDEFVKQKVYPIDGEIQSMFVADFNNDQRSDLIVLLKNSQKIFILFNIGLDDFFSQTKIFDIGCQGYEVTVADMNNDGFVDAVVTCPFDRQIIVVENLGDETFVINSTIKISSQPLSIVVADLNQDEKLDMITINRQINSIEIFIQKNPSEWTKSQSFQTDFELCQIRLGHVDADEKLDLIVSSCEKNFLVLFQNIDGEHFQNPKFSYFRTNPIGFDQIDSSIYIVQQTSIGLLETVCQ